jgi:hypothetical protein
MKNVLCDNDANRAAQTEKSRESWWTGIPIPKKQKKIFREKWGGLEFMFSEKKLERTTPERGRYSARKKRYMPRGTLI